MIPAPKGRHLWFYNLANDRKVNLEDTFNLMFSVRLLLRSLEIADSLFFTCLGHCSNNNDAPNSSTHISYAIFFLKEPSFLFFKALRKNFLLSFYRKIKVFCWSFYTLHALLCMVIQSRYLLHLG